MFPCIHEMLWNYIITQKIYTSDTQSLALFQAEMMDVILVIFMQIPAVSREIMITLPVHISYMFGTECKRKNMFRCKVTLCV